MRLATVFKRLLGMGRERVVAVEVLGEAANRVVVVELALPARRKLFCSGASRPGGKAPEGGQFFNRQQGVSFQPSLTLRAFHETVGRFVRWKDRATKST